MQLRRLAEWMDRNPIPTEFPLLHRADLDALVEADTLNVPALIAFFKQDPFLKLAFEAPLGVYEKYLSQEHHGRVLTQFEIQSANFCFDSRYGFVRKPLMRMVVGTHDLGKPLAALKEGIDAQHQYTEPLLRALLQHLAYTPAEIDFVCGMACSDPVGYYMKGGATLAGWRQALRELEFSASEIGKLQHPILTSPEAAALLAEKHAPVALAEITQKARQAGMSPKNYFELLLLYYVSDAADYPGVRRFLFIQDLHSGRLDFKKDVYLYGLLREQLETLGL